MASTTLTSLSPSSLAAGSPGFTLTINGTGFLSGAAAQWNGTPLATTLVSATQLTAIVPDALVAKSGVGSITVLENGTISNALSCVVTNAIDLTTLADVKQTLQIGANSSGIPLTADDDWLQKRITSVSQDWLTQTGRISLNSIQTVSERYDGNGRDTLLLRQWPIRSVVSLSVSGLSLPASPDYLQPGWVLNQQQTGIVLIGAACGTLFEFGRLNIAVTYTAGYPETPYDVAEAVLKQVCILFKRKGTIDLESNSLPGGGGTTKFRSWAIPPEVCEVINNYRRWWP